MSTDRRHAKCGVIYVCSSVYQITFLLNVLEFSYLLLPIQGKQVIFHFALSEIAKDTSVEHFVNPTLSCAQTNGVYRLQNKWRLQLLSAYSHIN